MVIQRNEIMSAGQLNSNSNVRKAINPTGVNPAANTAQKGYYMSKAGDDGSAAIYSMIDEFQ